MTESNHREIYEYSVELRDTDLVCSLVDRVYPVLQMVQGSQNVATREEVAQTIALQVAILEESPTLNDTGCSGGITTTRAPGGHSYMVHVWAASVGTLELSMMKENKA